ncbi:hypothetical protein ACROYT_G024242 [Oculina patagonica]
MKFVIVAVFMAIVLAVGVDSAFVHNVTNETLIINGTANIHANVQLHVAIEEIWAGLTEGHRYPIINSGDTIALRWAYTSGSNSRYWLHCYTPSCNWSSCPGTIITSAGWSSCTKRIMFTITAKGKMDGEAINSGDTVSLSSNYYGSSYRLHCNVSSTSQCRVNSVTSSMTGGAWLTYSYATFEIYAKNADDGTPVQYGDVVGLKYPYSSNSAWLSYYGSGYRYSPRSCSSNSKTSCAADNTNSGFKIFKKLS